MHRIGLCAATLLLTTAALAGETAKPTTAAAPKGEAIVGTHEATATVTKIDMKTREVTVKTEDGEEVTFVADERVKNLPQVKVGDRIKAVYTEAIAYEVKKGGKAMGVAEHSTTDIAKPGAKPAAAVGHQVTVTVTVTAIDPKVPSITFMGPKGNTQTVKVRHPEKLQGVAVGDAVDITYTEALAVKVEEAPKM
jgi:hypothetical protein